MQFLKNQFEYLVQKQQYEQADSFVESLLYDNTISLLSRKDALSFFYRIGYVYPELTLQLCRQRADIPRPFINTLQIAAGKTPSLRLYKGADTLVSIKIALLRKNFLLVRFLIFYFYKQFGLIPISLVEGNKLLVGNNRTKVIKIHNSDKISVIVTTYNSENFITNCVKSLLNQTLSNIEIIVVDDASTDNTIEIVKEFPQIKLIKLNNNKGTYHARNIGVAHSTGKFVTFQDSDDWSHPQRLELQLDQLTSDNNTVANFSNFFRIDQVTGLPCCRQNYPLLRLNLSSMMIPKNTLIALGLFDDNHRIESDKKLKHKIIGYYGEESINYIKLPLAIGLLRNNSLTSSKSSGFNRYGYSSHRKLI